VYGPASRGLLSEAEALMSENYHVNEAGLRRKEGDYRAELVRLQGTLSYTLKAHKMLEAEHYKVLTELGEAAQATVAEQA
jgi:hypothetical protein